MIQMAVSITKEFVLVRHEKIPEHRIKQRTFAGKQSEPSKTSMYEIFKNKIDRIK